MTKRTGEKLGWTLGWIGGFIWVGVIAVIFLCRGAWWKGLAGLGLTGAAVGVILFFAPWRFPSTAYWRLMLPACGLFALSVVWVIWIFDGFSSGQLRWWYLVWGLPMLSPLITIGWRRWETEATTKQDPDATTHQKPIMKNEGP